MIFRTSQTYLFRMAQYRDTCTSWDIVSSVCKITEMIESCFYAGKIIRVISVRNMNLNCFVNKASAVICLVT